MNEQDVYANVEGPSGPHIKWERVKSSENIYQNEDACCSVETDTTGPALSALQESSTVRNGSYRTPTVILGVLCPLLLVGFTTVFVLYTESSSKWEMKRIQFQTSYNNLTEENEQLQNSYNNLTEENNQLQKQIHYHFKERVRQTSQQKSLTEERDVLRKKLDDFIYYSQHEWVYFSGSFYYISSNMKTWQQSREDCQQKKADLIIINSKEEQDFCKKSQKTMWIGLTDRETDGVWKWVDGTLLTKSDSFWGSNEPNSYQGKDEDCAVTGYHSGEKSWNDDKCEKEKLWICEKRMSL